MKAFLIPHLWTVWNRHYVLVHFVAEPYRIAAFHQTKANRGTILVAFQTLFNFPVM